jgi:DNA-binding XRE family transcriptional regulator
VKALKKAGLVRLLVEPVLLDRGKIRVYLLLMTIEMWVGVQIRRLRLERDEPLTQKQLARLVGVEQSCVSHWERGVTCPSLPSLRKVAGVLGVSAADLLRDCIESRSDQREKALGS